MSANINTILFRADSSSTIGTGHIMRDLVLAEQFKDAKIIFATQDLPGNINHKIKEKEYKVELLDSNDIEEVIGLIKKHAVDMIVIDHYGIDYNYEKELKEKTSITIFILDDTYEKHHCDILLNHNIYAEERRYQGLVPKGCELRCGAKYTLLRNEFILEKQKTKMPSVKNPKINVFIAMGGADHSNINISILKVLESFPRLHAHVVTTTANAHLVVLKEFTQGKQNITLHINTNQIAKMIHEADFAIITPSVIVNEILYMELPFIAIKTAENQNEMYRYLIKNSYIALEQFNSFQLKNKIIKLLDLVDIELINFIDLSSIDQKMILEWRNDPSIRKWMFTQDKIQLRDHLNYIASLRTRQDRLYFLVKKGDQGIGVIDFTNIDHKSKTAEFGLYAKPGFKGTGSLLMKLIIDYAFRVLKVKTLISQVLEENISAIKLYGRYNFKKTNTDKVNQQNIIRMELNNEDR